MNKQKTISELTTFLAYAVSHRIGSIVNKDEIYADKYRKEPEEFMKKAKIISFTQNWNEYDKIIIKEKFRKNVESELTRKNFLNNRKFEIMDEEIDKCLNELNLL